MKLKELKHNHSLTDLLKVLIFSILMITPLLSVATRCLYVICNKNAYESYSGNTWTTYEDVYYETNSPTSIDEINTNNAYRINLNTLNVSDTTRFLYFEKVLGHNLPSNLLNSDSTSTTVPYLIRFANSTYYYIYVEQTPPNNRYTVSTLNEYFIDVQLRANTNESLEYYLPLITATNTEYLKERIEIVQQNTLDNVFEYSVNKLAESPILSWTQQTAIYTGVNTMTTQLGVNAPTIPMLIVYWFLLTVIYIIIDIIIKLFTWLTHMIGSKSV